MADGRHIENRILAISRRMIIRLTRIKAESRSNTGHAHDQNTKFRKFKMVVGRHFENAFIAITHPISAQFSVQRQVTLPWTVT